MTTEGMTPAEIIAAQQIANISGDLVGGTVASTSGNLILPEPKAVRPATPDEITSVITWLPSVDADPNVWDAGKIAERWTGGVAGTIRAYWYQRVSDTAGYLDVPDPGGTLPITQIYRQAREMLEYWDAWILKYGANADPSDLIGAGNQASVGKIKRRYNNRYGIRPLDPWNYRTPYPRA